MTAAGAVAVEEVSPRVSFFEGIEIGTLSGLGGGLAFGVLMGMQGMLPMVGMLVGADNAIIGLIVHLLISIGIGVSYGILSLPMPISVGLHLLSGITYGVVWWVLGALFLMPLMMGMDDMIFVIGDMQWMSLIGHIIFGAVMGILFGLLGKR